MSKEELDLELKKFEGNPIIQPDPDSPWESKATFNPAAIYEDGKIHILYRAIGDNDVSVLGYASSLDGFTIHERLRQPAYQPTEVFEGAVSRKTASYSDQYISGGGGYGGCEDPRLTKIDGRIYMTYVAFNGYSHPRVALTSINLADFLQQNWDWVKPILISPPEIVNKNACILPEKINGKYVIFHRVFPDILIDYLDDLGFAGEQRWLEGHYKIKPRPDCWDSRKIGVGAPPIKTEKGWLLIYQGVGNQDPGRYKIGAMLLDLYNPTKVIARAKDPILKPDEEYENAGWKAGVAYPCGAVVVDGQLIVYYGGADTVVCTAVADLNDFLNKMTHGQKAILKPLSALKNILQRRKK